MGFSFFFDGLWRTEVSVLGRTVPPEHGKREQNLKFPEWALTVLFDGLSWISPMRAWGGVESRSALDQNTSWVIVGYPR